MDPGGMPCLAGSGAGSEATPSRQQPTYNEPTARADEDDTVPNRGATPEPHPILTPPPPAPGPTALLISLPVALILALVGIVILLLRK